MCAIDTVTRRLRTVPSPLSVITSPTPSGRFSGITSSGDDDPVTTSPASPTGPWWKAITSPGPPMSEMVSPASEPSHSREAGTVACETAVPAVAPYRSPMSPWFSACSRSRCPSAWRSAHW